ncbi:MAG: ATP phosphoribosyltransferase regulatory subunit [Holosporales bacterium]
MTSPLLPVGLFDVLPGLAERRFFAAVRFVEKAVAKGFALVQPPLLEFADTPREDAFLVLDSHSRRPMHLRPDITPQVERLATSRLRDEPRPLRLCYAGEVLRSVGTPLRPERQFLELGAEVFGTASLMEILGLALEVLRALGVEGTVVSLCHPAWLRGQLAGMSPEVFSMVQQKQFSALEPTLRQRLEAWQDAGSRGEPPAGFVDADALAIQELTVVVRNNGGRLVCDWLESEGFSFQTGLCFALFVPGIAAEIGGGGVYRSVVGQEDAAGFSLYVETLLGVVGV